MDFRQLYSQHQTQLEDFWGRRPNSPLFQQQLTLFDRVVQITSNDEAPLAAANLSAPLFSTSPLVDRPPFTVHFIVRPSPINPGPPPTDLFTINRYTGWGDWLSIQIGAWGHCQIDLAQGRAMAVLDPNLAQHPDRVSRGLCNTIFTNFFIGQGYGMLHCTGLARNGHVLLLMAPHNSGKSTTAFRLVLAGNPLISDSMIFVAPDNPHLHLLGFPIARLKLRPDMVPLFPEVHHLLSPEPVRDEVKQIFDLRQWRPELALTAGVEPQSLRLCLLRRSGEKRTHLSQATRSEVEEAVLLNSIFYDDAAAWQRNWHQVERVIAAARPYHLSIGTEGEGIVAAAEQLWADS